MNHNYLRIYFKCEDLHAYFTTLADRKELPTFEDLEVGARYLYDTYASTVAQREAARDARDGQAEWARNVPLGTPWVPLPADTTSASAPKKKRKRKSNKAGASESAVPPKLPLPPPPPLPFYGDQVVSDDAGFMRDASLSRIVSSSVAIGDVGRMWEGLKVGYLDFSAEGLLISRHILRRS